MGTGSNKDEGSFFVIYAFLDLFDKDTGLKHPLTVETTAMAVDRIFPELTSSDKQDVINHYTGGSGIADEKAIVDMMSEYFFICPNVKFANTYASVGGNVYYYYLDYRTSSQPWGNWMGVMHGDDIPYVFGHPFNPLTADLYTESEKQLSRDVMQYFTSFAKTGKVDADWPLYSKENPVYFDFNTSGSYTGLGVRAANCSFWN